MGSPRSPKGLKVALAGVNRLLSICGQMGGMPFVNLATVCIWAGVGTDLIATYFEICTHEWAKPISVVTELTCLKALCLME